MDQFVAAVYTTLLRRISKLALQITVPKNVEQQNDIAVWSSAFLAFIIIHLFENLAERIPIDHIRYL